MFDIKLTVTKDNTAGLKRALRELERKEVLVGFPDTGEQRDDPAQSNAYLAFIHDQGSPAQNIPPRPFMEPGVESAEAGIVHGFEDAAKAALDGNLAAMDKGLHKAGLAAQAGVKHVIVQGVPPPLAACTLAKRRSRGIASTKPLLASRQMFNAVTYVVVPKKPSR
jgi:hypothetical protein